MAVVRMRASVNGAVQGVGYRYFAIRTARALGVSGFVRNERDGSVTVTAEGRRDVLDSLLGSLKEGPARGLVKEVNVDWTEATGEFSGFDVRF